MKSKVIKAKVFPSANDRHLLLQIKCANKAIRATLLINFIYYSSHRSAKVQKMQLFPNKHRESDGRKRVQRLKADIQSIYPMGAIRDGSSTAHIVTLGFPTQSECEPTLICPRHFSLSASRSLSGATI